MRLAALLALVSLLAAGCDEKGPVTAPAIPIQHAWIGSYTGVSGQGDVVLDVTQTGSAVSGEIVFGPFGPLGETHLWVTGTMSSDSMFLARDSSHPFPPADFSLRARAVAGGGLSGKLTIASAGLDADLSCRVLERREIATDVAHDVHLDVLAIAYDGNRLWLSTGRGYYFLMDPGGTIVDTVAIYHEPAALWTSTVLMFNGALLWGVYPITIMGSGGSSTNVADLLAFNENGRAPDSLRIDHRPAGLAYDGAHTWSLRDNPAALVRLDGAGAVADSLHLGIPDAYLLAFDGAHFWTVGWYLRRLYKVDLRGHVEAFCDLPHRVPWDFAVGLTAEGPYIWYGEDASSGTTLHRMTIR